MELMLLRTFQVQTARQCQFIVIAARDINTAIKDLDKGGDVRSVFYGIQNPLNVAANVSNAL